MTVTRARQTGKVQTLVLIARLIRQRRQALTGQPTQFPSGRVESITHCPWPLHKGDHSLVRCSEPGKSCTGEQMTTTESSYLCVPGEHLLMFRPCSRASTTKPWRPDDLLDMEESSVSECSGHPGILLIFGRASSSTPSAPFLKPRAGGSPSAPIRAGCKGDGALGVTSKCPLDRYGERRGGRICSCSNASCSAEQLLQSF